MNCHLDRLLFPVISTERSEWRDLINASFGASGKPQRCLDYARHDSGGGEVLDKPSGKAERSTTLEMTDFRSK